MDVVVKGNPLEDAIFNIIQYILKSDRLRLSPVQAKLFRKRIYFPQERQTKIASDISIELWLPQALHYSRLWMCIFKNYDHIVPVSDLEGYKTKLDQMGSRNIKGVIASANAVQHEALDYARANDMGIIRILPNDRVRWVIDKANIAASGSEEEANPREITTGLTSQNHTGQNHNLYAFYDGYVFDNLNGFLSRMLKA